MSMDMVYEDVPRLNRRVGDLILANENNATILLGRDRNGPVDSGYGSLTSATRGKGAGAVTVVAGRQNADPSVTDDASTLYLSAKADPDEVASTQRVGSPVQGASAAILRADCVRIVPRRDYKVSVGSAYLLMESNGRITIEGDISLGDGASERLLKESFATQVYPYHTHPAVGGSTGPPAQPVLPTVYTQRVRG